MRGFCCEGSLRGGSMAEFISGLKLSELFYQEAVKPILEKHFPELQYAAGLVGSGSEVLGFDTPMSRDHHWGPRVMLFLSEADNAQYASAITETLSHELPYTFRGYSTNFTPPNPDDNGTQLLEVVESGPVNHRVEIDSLRAYCAGYLGVDPFGELSAVDWLTVPGQKLRAMTAGVVYHDGPGDLTQLRARLAYYPQDVWLYLLAAGWARIGQEEHFLGRTGYVGDELGSRIIGARLVHDLMNLCFLMEKQYAPYSKWFGTAFAKLPCAEKLPPLFHAVFDAQTWQEREKPLCAAYQIVAEMHNALAITDPLPTAVSEFHGRPFQVIHGDHFVSAIIAQIQDDAVKRIAARTHIGAVEQFSTSTDVLSDPRITRKMGEVYR
jgi:hypothetical protein